ncbi:pentapeptide repeat-containing protein [Candidatus Protochlamydia sp. W-9]|uniref:pentapeptide repeat-containing protein n=1 Tax=Candidatus Protochlamydia sp. W-9 TaxID=1785087 RepID=UPI00096A90F3|nr:pentapeptide repeat-containing protein [Candidatus Protochlamydia sp. W-9]
MLLPSNIVSNIDSTIFIDNEQIHSFPSSLAIKIGLEIFKYLESLDRGQAKLVCRKWKQLIDKIHIIERYNIRLMNATEIRQEATHYLRNPEKLKAEQRFLLTIVRLSKDCIKIKAAAANALMILKKTNFSFVGSDFRGIQAPGVRLARTILDKVNFSEANLEGANFTSCSLEDVILDGSELRDVQFGQLPYLNHQDDVIAMTMSPDGKYLASVDWGNFYIWNLETFEVQMQPLEIENTERTFIQFFQNGQFLFKATSKKKGKTPQKARIEIWKTAPLEMTNSLVIDDIELFSLLALTQDGNMLISVAEKFFNGKNGKIEICLWQIDFNDQNLPQITPVKTKTLTGTLSNDICKCSYAPKTSIIAIAKLFNPLFTKSVKLYTLPNLEIKQKLTLKKGKFLNSMIFTPQGNQLIISLFKTTGKNKIYSWNIKNKQIKSLFSEEFFITYLHFLPDSSQIAYFADKRNENFFRIRDKDFKLIFSERFSKSNYKYGIITQNFISNGQFIFRPKIKQIFITPLKTFVGKKVFPLSIRDMHFSPDEKTIIFWSYGSNFSFTLTNSFFTNIENMLYTYQTFNGKNLGYKELPTFFLEEKWGQDCQLSFDAQYCIRKYFPESNGKNKITISQVENEKIQVSYAGSFLSYFLSKDNRYFVFIYQNQLKLIEIDLKKHDQLVNVDSTKQKPTVFHSCLLGKKKIQYDFSDTLFPIATLALRNVETGDISLWEINWEIQQVQEMVLWSTKLPSTNFCLLDQSKFCFQESKFCFQKNKQTFAIWNKEIFSEEIIHLENELTDFDISDDGSWMVTIEKPLNSMSESVKSKFCLWNLDQMKELDHFTLPFDDSKFRLSTHGKFLIVNHSTSDFAELSIRKVKKGKFQLLWKLPHSLNVNRLSLKNTQNLDKINTLLLSQLQNEKAFS